MVKFCNISKETRLGIQAGGYIVTTEENAQKLAQKVNMGTDFVIVPEGVDPLKVIPPKKTWQKKR